eukprot:637380-Amphidinium_carterae.1
MENEEGKPSCSIYSMTRLEPGRVIADSGCLASVGGEEWHTQLQEMMRVQERPWLEIEERELYRFGAGPVQCSHKAFVYLVTLPGGQEQVWMVSSVPTTCPGLVSRHDLGRFRCTLDFEQRCLTFPEAAIQFESYEHPTFSVLSGGGGARRWSTQRRKQLAAAYDLDENYVLRLPECGKVANMCADDVYWATNDERVDDVYWANDEEVDENENLLCVGRHTSEDEETACTDELTVVDVEEQANNSETSHGGGVMRRAVPSDDSVSSEEDQNEHYVYYQSQASNRFVLNKKEQRKLRQNTRQMVLAATGQSREEPLHESVAEKREVARTVYWPTPRRGQRKHARVLVLAEIVFAIATCVASAAWQLHQPTVRVDAAYLERMAEQPPGLMIAHLRRNEWTRGEVSHHNRRRHYEIVEQMSWITEALQQQQDRGGWAVSLTSTKKSLEHPSMSAWTEHQEQVQWHVYVAIGDKDLMDELAIRLSELSVSKVRRLTRRQALRTLCEHLFQAAEDLSGVKDAFVEEDEPNQDGQLMPEPTSSIPADTSVEATTETTPPLMPPFEHTQADTKELEDWLGPFDGLEEDNPMDQDEELENVHVSRETKRAVRKAHAALGHPTPKVLARMLSLSGANKGAIVYAKHW